MGHRTVPTVAQPLCDLRREADRTRFMPTFERKICFHRQNIKCTLCYMKPQGEGSIWKSLAVAFGDGLAFGVGVKMAQSAARKRAGEIPAADSPVPVPV